MLRYISVLAALATLAACDRAPATDERNRVAVIAGRAMPPSVITNGMPAAAAASRPATASAPQRLSVAESAQINTTEMWSEPLTRDARDDRQENGL